MADVINRSLEECFFEKADKEKAVQIIAEPGAYFAMPSTDLVTNIIGARTNTVGDSLNFQKDSPKMEYFINDGNQSSLFLRGIVPELILHVEVRAVKEKQTAEILVAFDDAYMFYDEPCISVEITTVINYHNRIKAINNVKFRLYIHAYKKAGNTNSTKSTTQITSRHTKVTQKNPEFYLTEWNRKYRPSAITTDCACSFFFY